MSIDKYVMGLENHYDEITEERWSEKCRPIFEWIKEYFAENLRMPTNREMIAAGLTSSTSQSSQRLSEMEELGWLESVQTGMCTRYRIVGAKVVFE